MKRYRFLFSLWLIFWAFVWIFSNGNIGIYIISASTVCVVTEALSAFIAKKNLSVQLTVSATVRKKSETLLTVFIQNDGFTSGGKVQVDVYFRNMLTGENTSKKVYASVACHSDVSVKVPLREEYCGKLIITATQITVYDAFNLFSFKKSTDVKTSVLIMPDIYPVEISSGLQRQMDINSDEYSMLYLGDDPGETFSLREYRPGDRIKNIHWKISEKIGTFTVRELGLPVNNSLLLLLDNSAVKKVPDTDMLEFLGETAVSISTALISMCFSHDIAWLDRERNEVVVCHIVGEDDITTVMSGFLSAVTEKDKKTVLERFVEEHELSDFAHILVISMNTGNKEELWGNTNVIHFLPSISDKEKLYVEF